jgi:uroporphyrinogen decarboxylase
MLDCFWFSTMTRWKEQGAPLGADLQSEYSAGEYFGFDFSMLFIDSSMRFPEKLIEETDEYRIWEDKLGYTNKTFKTGPNATRVGGYLDHKVKTRQDWETHRGRLQMVSGQSPRLIVNSYAQPFAEPATWDDVAKRYREFQQQGMYKLFVAYGPFEATWRHHGFERTLVDLKAHPGLMWEMFERHVTFLIQILDDAMSRGFIPDGVFFSEDVAYKTGTYFSPETYRTLLYPCHRKLGEYLRGKAIDYFFHSDGDVRELIPALIDAGVNVLQPLEVASGLDVVALKEEYGNDLTLMGNISTRAMAGSRAEIEKEIRSKIPVAMESGGYIFHSDHSVPPDVGWDNYQYVMQLVHQYGTY